MRGAQGVADGSGLPVDVGVEPLGQFAGGIGHPGLSPQMAAAGVAAHRRGALFAQSGTMCLAGLGDADDDLVGRHADGDEGDDEADDREGQDGCWGGTIDDLVVEVVHGDSCV